jgi:hypothetical protein
MENNIFFKNKKDKFNPDVINNLSKKTSERKKTEFIESKIIYNGITNDVPNKIKNSNDLKLDIDETIDTNTMRKIIKQKEDERSKQDYDLKPQKLKCLPENLIIDKHIENFDELKKNSESYIKKTVQEQSVQKSKYDNIISNLKDLGIFSDTNKY